MYACPAGNRPPEKPKFQRDQSAIAFDGTVAARHIAADGSAEYVHLVFGSNAYSEGQKANIVDAEFLFLTGVYVLLICAVEHRAFVSVHGNAIDWTGRQPPLQLMLDIRIFLYVIISHCYVLVTLRIDVCFQVTTLLTSEQAQG